MTAVLYQRQQQLITEIAHWATLLFDLSPNSLSESSV